MELRPYQQKYVDGIKLHKSNLVIASMGAGKSLILKSIVDKYFQNKKVLVVSNRRALILQLSNYFPESTFILSGKKHDSSHNIHLCTAQTFARREYKLTDYDLIAVDEIHEVYNMKLVKEIRELSCTRLYLTGTPLNSRGAFLGKFDNTLEFTSMSQMIRDGFLAQTRFMSKANILSAEKNIGTRNGDYIESDIEQEIDKQEIIKWVIKDSLEYEWATKHKCIVYVNSINTATKMVTAFNDTTNVKVLHSKLGKTALESITEWFAECDHGIIINVRMMTTGTDIPSVDTIINLTTTRVASLFLQLIWRGSRKYGDKITNVYDYSGVLGRISPYFNDWRSSKAECKEQCKEFTNLIEQHFCEESCKGDPVMVNCTGKQPYSHQDNPYVEDFRVISGESCGESFPVWKMSYKSMSPEGSIGIVHKYSKCPCGLVTRFTLRTLTDPSDMIELYREDVHMNNVLVLYNRELKKAFALLDNPSKANYKLMMFDSSEDLYTAALKFFNNKPFQIKANIKMKLPNATVDHKLEYGVLLVNWEGNNAGFVKKLIRVKLEHILEFLSIKKGYAHYNIAKVTPSNQKAVISFLNSDGITRSSLVKYFSNLKE